MKLDKPILHLDDSRIAIKLLQGAMRNYADIVGVQDLREARAAIADGKDYACFVIDNHLVDGTGLDFVKDLKQSEQYKKVPIILFTATLTNAVAHKAMQMGVNESLPKVINNKDLVHEILSQISNPRMKVVVKEYHEVYCARWEQDGVHYQYSPDIKETVSGIDQVEARENMEYALKEKLNSDAYQDHVVHEIELEKHIIFTQNGSETRNYSAIKEAIKHPRTLD